MQRIYFHRIFKTALALSAILTGSCLAVAFEFNPEIERLQKSIEGKVQQELATFLGADIKIVTSVHIQEAETSVTPLRQKAEPGMDILYAPGSFISEPVAAPPKDRLAIKSVEIDVQIAGEVEENSLSDARNMIIRSFKGMNPRVNVEKMKVPAKQIAPNKLDWKPFLPFGTAVFSAMILALGIIFIGSALRGAADNLVQGLSRIFVSGKSSDSLGVEGADGKPIVLEHRNSFGTGNQKDKGTQAPPSAQDTTRNIQIFRESLTSNPLFFLRTLSDSEMDLRGIKWILPHLTLDEQKAVRTFLGDVRVQKIAEIGEGSQAVDFTSWLQNFTERLMLIRIQEHTVVEKAIKAEHISQLYLARPQDLIRCVTSINTPAAWRVLSEFLPKNNLNKVIGELPPEQWQQLLLAAQPNAAEILKATEEILAQLSSLPSVDQESQERAKFYSKTLLEPVLNSLASKEFDEEGKILDQLSSSAPELATLVREQLWTPKDLALVPDEILSQFMRSLKNEQRAALIYALPEELSTRLTELLPQGNVKTIVLDQLDRLQKRNDPQDMKSAITAVRQMINELRKRHLAGAFKLLTPVDEDTLQKAA